MWFILMLAIAVAGSKNILLSAAYLQIGHSSPFKQLAKRLSQEADFHCIVVAEPEFKEFWEDVNCTILFLHKNEEIEEFKLLQESTTNNLEKGLSEVIHAQDILVYPYPLWEKVNMLKQLQDIGIDMAICDVFSIQCLTTVHNLKIPKVVYMSSTCFVGTITTIHKRDTNRIPFETFAWKNPGFFDRLLNTLKYKLFDVFINWVTNGILSQYAPDALKGDWRSNTLHKREALYFEPCIPFFNFGEQLPPNYIHTGPLINRKSNPLPDSILEFIKLYNQIIYVSFGSITITYDISQIIILANRLPMVGFVISYAKDYSNIVEIPKNCLILPWVPQFDLLASGRVNLFITHSGWNSFCESLFNAIPMINCGWAIDRFDSSFLAEFRKVGKTIQSKAEFTADNLLKVSQEIINDPSYKENALKYSKMLKKSDPEGKIVDAVKMYFEMGIENLVLEDFYNLCWFQKIYLDIYVFWLGCTVFLIWFALIVFKLIWKILILCFGVHIIEEKEN